MSTTLFVVVFDHLCENAMFLMLLPSMVCSSMRNIAVLDRTLSPSLMDAALLRYMRIVERKAPLTRRCIGVYGGTWNGVPIRYGRMSRSSRNNQLPSGDPFFVFYDSRTSFCGVMQQLLIRLPRWGRNENNNYQPIFSSLTCSLRTYISGVRRILCGFFGDAPFRTFRCSRFLRVRSSLCIADWW